MFLQNPYWLSALALLPLYWWLKRFRLRPRRTVVSSLYFWEQLGTADQRQQRAYRRRFTLPFLAQTAALGLAVLGMAGPEWERPRSQPQSWIVVLDNSVGMSARLPDGQTRWERAREHLDDFLSRLPPGSEVAAVVGSSARRLQTQDFVPPGRARAFLFAAAQTHLPGRPEELLESACGLLAVREQARFLWASYRAAPALEEWDPSPVVASCLVGDRGVNAGIVAWQVREQSDGRLVLFVRVANFSDEEWKGRLLLPDGSARAVSLAPGGSENVIWPSVPFEGEALSLRLQPEGSMEVMGADNVVWAVDPRRTGGTVLVAGRPCKETIRVLEALGQEVRTVPSLEEERGSSLLRIANGIVVGEAAQGPLVLIDPPREVGPFRSGEVVLEPDSVGQDSTHPLLHHVLLSEVRIRKVRTIQREGEGLRALAWVAEGPFLAVGQRDSGPWLYIGMDLTFGVDTLWAEHEYFVIFWQNLLSWLAPQAAARPGEWVWLRVGEEVRGLEGEVEGVVRIEPDGSETAVPRVGWNGRAGLYRLTMAGGRERELAVNIVQEEAGDIRGEERVDYAEMLDRDETGVVRYRDSVAAWCFLMAIVLLGLGWWLESRI